MKNNKSFLLMLIGASFLFISIYFRKTIIIKVRNVLKKKKNPLLSINGKTIFDGDDFDILIKFISKMDPNFAFLYFLPEHEQVNFYKKIINEYIIESYLVEKYIKNNKIDKEEGFTDDYENYINLMKKNYYISFIQKKINDTLVIENYEAETFYNTNKQNLSEFLSSPFIKKVPGIDARAIKVEEGIDKLVYESQLKNNENVIPLERVSNAIRGISPILINTLYEMADQEIRFITLENGMQFALYRIKEHIGEWAEYVEVAEEVKNVMRGFLLEKKYKELIDDLYKEYNVIINDQNIKKYCDNKKDNRDKSFLSIDNINKKEDENKNLYDEEEKIDELKEDEVILEK